MSVQRDWINVNKGPPTMREIMRDVADRHGIRVSDITGPVSAKWASGPRREFYFRARETGKSLTQIGQAAGGRHHTTVLKVMQAYSERMCGEAVD